MEPPTPSTALVPRAPAGIGGALFALMVAGLGIVSLAFGRFAEVLQPVPAWVPAQRLLAYASGAIMIACGAGLLRTRTAALAARVLAGYIVLWIVLLELPPIVMHPAVEAAWAGCGEITILLGGAWILVTRHPGSSASRVAGPGGVRIARYLMAYGMVALGIEHLVYADATAQFVPRWLPFPHFWAALTGAGHLAAGLALGFGIVPRLAAMAEAAMLASFTVLVWLPGFASKPADLTQWTETLLSAAITFAVWLLAEEVRSPHESLQSPPARDHQGA